MNRACVIYSTSLMSSNSFIYFNITTKISLFFHYFPFPVVLPPEKTAIILYESVLPYPDSVYNTVYYRMRF